MKANPSPRDLIYLQSFIIKLFEQGSQILAQSGSDWLQKLAREIRDFFFRSDSVHFGSASQNLLKSDLKGPGFSHLGPIWPPLGPHLSSLFLRYRTLNSRNLIVTFGRLEWRTKHGTCIWIVWFKKKQNYPDKKFFSPGSGYILVYIFGILKKTFYFIKGYIGTLEKSWYFFLKSQL